MQCCKRHIKQLCYKTQCKDLKHNTKKLWQLINGIVNKTKNKMHVIDCLKVNAEELTELHSIANEFGKYFSIIGKRFAEQITNPKVSVDKYLEMIPKNESSLFLYPTNGLEKINTGIT